MGELICPVCQRPLWRMEKSYRCEQGHSFDLAKSGYVNLLPPSPSGKRHGDDKRMVKARTAFLEQGYYAPLADCLAQLAVRYTGDSPLLLDAGCGEGYYTVHIGRTLQQAGKQPSVIGLDISKDALHEAGKREKRWTWCVGSTASIPVADERVSLLLNVFSPLFSQEFARVLQAEGVLLRVVPLEQHLWELKEQIYAKPYRNPAPVWDLEGFRCLETQELSYELELKGQDAIQSLFQMTPYYYKTGVEDQAKLTQLSALTTTIAFGIGVYRKG